MHFTKLPAVLVALCCIHFTATAQEFKEKSLQTAITNVTVFLSGAQVSESGKTTLAPGYTELIITGLSPYLNTNSLQVKGLGNFTVLSVNPRKNYLAKTKQDEKIDSLENVLEKLNDKMTADRSRLEVLSEKQSVLHQNKDMSRNANISLTQLKSAIEFFDAELTKIKTEEVSLRKKAAADQKQKTDLENQLNALQSKSKEPVSEVVVRVQSDSTVAANFELTYLVSNAGWYPKYDIRLENIQQPLSLLYKAEVYQNTGVDWDRVKLVFSNGNPNKSSVSPDLEPWKLNYARNTIYKRNRGNGIVSGMVSGRVYDENGPLPGANVIVVGTNIGTQTDYDGYYSLTLPNGATALSISYVGFESRQVPISGDEVNVKLQESSMQLDEVVVTGYGASRKLEGRASGVQIEKANTLITEFTETQTTVEIAVEQPYSIKSGGDKRMVDLRDYTINAEYNYIAIPKLDKDAFLMARITDWGQYNLLEGEANLYFEKGFVGRTILDANALSDTLEISLGRDQNIVIARNKEEEFSKKRTLGSNKIESRGYKITVRNKKASAINLTIFDQIPVSVVSDISVTPGNLNDAQFDSQTGALKWIFTLPAQAQKEILFDYEVKYPKREKLILD
ncbi:MAG: mucoidy inhibitor MuiA family protein [Bacteroidetes bacterium]|nr:mucoidy inhibitor MuiA family protein [Bacteroidota bacterium]